MSSIEDLPLMNSVAVRTASGAASPVRQYESAGVKGIGHAELSPRDCRELAEALIKHCALFV
jgi:hypothetical protein